MQCLLKVEQVELIMDSHFLDLIGNWRCSPPSKTHTACVHLQVIFLKLISSCGGLEVELWTDNSLPSASRLRQCIYKVPYGRAI